MTKTKFKLLYSKNLFLTKNLYGRVMPVTALRLTKCDQVLEEAKNYNGKGLEIKRA